MRGARLSPHTSFLSRALPSTDVDFCWQQVKLGWQPVFCLRFALRHEQSKIVNPFFLASRRRLAVSSQIESECCGWRVDVQRFWLIGKLD
jgi:hypothetical protein